MYEKCNTVPLASNSSFVPQNLSISKSQNGNNISYVAVSRNIINITSSNKNGTQLDQKQTIPKISKDETTALINGPDNMLLASLIQSKFIKLTQRIILVVCATKGIFFFDEDGSNLLYFHTFRGMKTNSTEGTLYGRGIASVGENFIAIGTSSGCILLFEVASKGNNISLVHKIEKSSYGITDLVSDGEFLIAADSNGNVFNWLVRSEKNIKLIFENSDRNSCTSLGIWRNYVIVGYCNGKVTIFNLETGAKLVDISAHARWLHCLDVADNLFVTAGEDSFFRVWELDEINGRLKVNALHSELVPNTQICGIAFNNGTEQICVSAFDTNEITIYNAL